eukprot:1000797-Pleurochrysis_carterae.AAC.1
MEDKINKREQEHQSASDQRNAHLLVSVSEAPSRMENFNTPSTQASGIGALAVNSPFGLVMAENPEPNGSSKSHPNQKRGRR